MVCWLTDINFYCQFIQSKQIDSWHQLIIIRCIPLLKSLVNKQFNKKYSLAFQFFKARPINQLIHGSYSSQIYIEFNDIRTYIDQTEFLRREYYFRTATGKPEIDHRIKLCSQYYAKIQQVAHQYPMMIITNTKSLFIRRNRRLKKIQAGQGSSDETERKDSHFVQFNQSWSIDMLDQLENSSLDGSRPQESLYESYDSSEFDMFGKQSHQEEENTYIQLKNIEESSLSHLISDYSSKTTIKLQKQDLRSTAPVQTMTSLEYIKNKNIENSISITAISTQNQFEKQRKRAQLSKYLDLLQDKRGTILSGLISNYEQSAGGDLLKKPSLQEVTGVGERGELESRRRRIREKAEELLRRAKRNSCDQNMEQR